MQIRVLVALATLGLQVSPALAQGWIEPPITTERRPPSRVVRLATTVRVTLDGRVARYEVEDRFRNDGGGLAEGTYLYPLPTDAAFNDFSLFQGDLELKGEVMNAEQARSIYEAIVRSQRDPALLTLAGHGLIRAQVFPIAAGETRRVILRYTQVLGRDGNLWRIRHALGARAGGQVDVTITAPAAARLGVPSSPTHPITWRIERGQLIVRAQAEPRGDLEVLLPARGGLMGTTLLTHAPGGPERFFMLVLSPPADGQEAALPKDLTLVADVSGSMSGTKLEQTKAALAEALGRLRPADRFRLITFSSGVTEFAPGYLAATREAVTRAQVFVDELSAHGGTNIEGALERALSGQCDPERLGVVVFLTDGLPSVGEQSPERLAASAAARRAERRVFAVGVGHDVNTWLLDRLSTEGRGKVEYVAPEGDVRESVSRLLARLEAPVLTDLRVVSAPVQLLERAPAALPDLFAGEELILTGRYQGTGHGAVVIEGRRGSRRERFSTIAEFPEHQRDNGFIAPLWAARRIGELTRQARLEGNNPGLVAQIRELGLRYGVITEYTSYLVLEPGQTVATAPAAPAAQTGNEAFRRAERSAQLAESKSLAAADAVAERGGRSSERRVGGRIFVQRGDVWTDAAHADSVQLVRVAAYSPAWFSLVRALPELAPWLEAGPEVLVAGRRISLRIGAEGLTAWANGELERTVREFRGR